MFMAEQSNSGETAADGPRAENQGSPQRPTRALRETLKLRPMEAVSILYDAKNADPAEAVFACLSRAIFEGDAPPVANLAKRLLARLNYRVLMRTTRRHDAPSHSGGVRYRNRLLERSRHPYAAALLASSSRETEALVEGGDPMNGPYMMIAPEIREACNVWDKIFFNSVQGRDVQLRFIWETRATFEEARLRLERGLPVRLKALAAGTGLSMLLAYDRLIQCGFDPAQIAVSITDRDPVNTEKTERLVAKLAPFRGWTANGGFGSGVLACTEDIFSNPDSADASDLTTQHDLVTAVGILEYLQGHTLDTTEKRLKLAELPEEATARDLAARLCAMTRPDGSLIINTYRPHSSTRILELFGKRFDYRDAHHVTQVMAGTQFQVPIIIGSGLIYDVKVFRKQAPGSAPGPGAPV